MTNENTDYAKPVEVPSIVTRILHSSAYVHLSAEDRAVIRDVIERLVRERDEARAKTAISMGVGDGSGNLFVYGDYDSIKAAQGFVTRIEELVRERDEARAERDRDCIALGLEIKALRNDAEAAEAEVASLKKGRDNILVEAVRLREALGDVKRMAQIDPGPLPHESEVVVKLQAAFEIARAALEAKHD